LSIQTESSVHPFDPVDSSSNNADVFESLAQAYRGLGRLKDAQSAEARAKARQKPKS